MANSNVQPVYPNAIFPWTDRVDNQSIDFANDINSTVAELESVETTIGIKPQVETGVPTGNPVSYSSVSSRISDAMVNAQLPYSYLNAPGGYDIPNNTGGSLIPLAVRLDPYGCFNGTDITIPANGWYSLSSTIIWPWWNNGYDYHFVSLNGSSFILEDALLDWQFSGNTLPETSGGPVLTPRWQLFGKRSLRTHITWEGALHKGDRISVYAENGTSNAAQATEDADLKIFMKRTIPSSVTFASG
jgi:hypothetical protein